MIWPARWAVFRKRWRAIYGLIAIAARSRNNDKIGTLPPNNLRVLGDGIRRISGCFIGSVVCSGWAVGCQRPT